MSDLRWWLSQARPYAGWFVLGLLLSILTVASNIALLAVSGGFIASMAAAGLSGAAINYFTPAAIIRALAITRTGGRYLERLVTHDATLRLLTRLRVWFYHQIEPLSTLDLRNGDLLARIRGDIDALDHVYLRLISPVAVGVICIVGAIAVMSFYSGAVALVNLAVLLAAGLGLPALVHRLGQAPGAASVARAAELKAAAVDWVEGLGELSVFGASARRRAQILAVGDDWIEQQSRLSHLTGLSNAGLLLLTNLALLATACLLIPVIRAGTLPGVDFATLLMLVLGCFEAVALMPGAWQALGQMRAATARLRHFEGLTPAVADPCDPVAAPTNDTLEFSHLAVRYDEAHDYALHDVSTRIDPGERIALVGASGAGKTSFIHVLLRLIEYEGQASWAGRAVRDYRAADLRARIAFVPQRVYLFHTTVRENLLVGNPEAGEAAMIEAATVAGIHDEIRALPDGYDTLVGEEGLRLSGGQIRRVGIARALLRDASVVILDEPFENLDNAAADALAARLDAYLRGRTLILVSHQMAWVQRADRILVFDRGRLAATGGHDTLWSSCEAYRRLHAAQLGSDATHSQLATRR